MWQKQNEQEMTEIDLTQIFQALLKSLWVIVAVAILFGVTAYIYSSYFITPTYRSGFTAYVNSRLTKEDGSSITTGELNASIGLTHLYEEIIKSRSVLTDAADNCDVAITYGQLSQMVSSTVSETAALITVYVEDTDPVRATALAEAIAEAAPEHVARVVDGSSMRIVDAPVEPVSQFAPNNVRNAALGAVVGILLAVAMIIILELTNDFARNAEDLEKRYQLSVIGIIPNIAAAEKSRDSFGYRRSAEDRR